MQLFQDIQAVIRSPSAFFEQQAKAPEMKRAIAVMAFVIVAGVFFDFFAAVLMLPAPLMLGMHENGAFLFIGGIIGGIMFIGMCLGTALFFLAILAGLWYIGAKICGGQGQYESLLVCLLFSQAVGIVTLPLYLLPPSLMETNLAVGIMIAAGIGFLGWSLYLNVLIMRKCCQLSLGKAILALLLSVFVSVLLVGAVAVIAYFAFVTLFAKFSVIGS